MRPIHGLIALSFVLAGCAERIADVKARSVQEAGISNAGAIRSRLFHATACVVSGQQVAEFTAMQTGEHAWTGHVVVEKPGEPCGSGVACAIAPGDRYITAAHCVDTPPITVLRMDSHMKAHLLPASVIWSDPVRDIAMISAPGCPDEPVLEPAVTTPHVGDVVAMLGNWDELSAGSVLDVEPERGRCIISAPTHPGDSGGPIVDVHCRLVGIVSAGMTRGFWKIRHFTKGALIGTDDLVRTTR